MITKAAFTSGTSVGPDADTDADTDADAVEGEKVDPEKASDFQLVDWIENDTEV